MTDEMNTGSEPAAITVRTGIVRLIGQKRVDDDGEEAVEKGEEAGKRGVMYWMRMGKEGEAPASKQYQPSYSSRYVSRLDAISVAITVCRFLGGYSHNWHAFLLYMKLLTEAAMQREERSEIADLDEPSLCRLTLVHVEHSSQPISSADNHSTTSSPSMEGAEAICCACGYLINDRFILKVMEDNYHESCLRCAACHQSLASNPTCYTKNGHIYCQQDHTLFVLLLLH
ncbi:unnamed protein product [Caenorhabditis auriculariae]|uniref:LIM zinc-binding domain-containing protein n=1 Tax=Caenorhabditis auriculariae TaxID=2777116 RepID=A0A8S1H153_9PELO|nr:unnamed protein product [Caenorhabditis auriculariae]